MAILFGTTKSRFPDFFAGTSTQADQLYDVAQDTLGKVLSIAGARVFNGSFVEDGVQSVNGSAFIGSSFNDLVQPSRRQFITQTPQATILIKKRMFSSLRSNYDVRFLDTDERLFMRAVKNLFRRKCEEIAFYENLVNIKKIVSDPSFLTVDGVISNFLDVLGLTGVTGQSLGSAFGSLIGSFSSEFPIFGDLINMAKINQRAKQNKYTTWIVDPDQPDFSGTGPGVGVIELTMMSNVSTNVSLARGSRGSCNFTVQDPYNLTLISEADVDMALQRARSEDGGMAGFLDETAQNNLRQAGDLDGVLNRRLRLRGASQVNFQFPLGPSAEPFGVIIETNQPFEADTVGSLGFDVFEHATILQILNLLKSYQTVQNRTSGMLLESTATSTAIRQKLRNEFVGHHIFQQMDSVHVFINSFTRNETPIYANRSEMVIGDILGAIVSPEEQSGRLSDEALDQEREVLAPNTPLLVYKLLRNPAEWRGTGPQIFSGLIKGVTSNYTAANNGTGFTVKVDVTDNLEFLDISTINTRPSLEQPEGVLMDPLTPYDLVTDPSTGLIKGVQLSQTNQERLKFLKFDSGFPPSSEDDFKNDIGESNASTVFIYQHVPGLVYKWKTGIVTASLNVNLTKPLDRRSATFTEVSEDFGISVVEDAFSNLDSADIMSLLITGQPYNYNNFIKNAIDAGTRTLDNDTNSRAYLNTLFDFLDRQQGVWGDFVPAKASVIDPEKSADLFRRQRDLTRTVTKVADLRLELAQLRDRLRKNATLTNNSTAADNSNIRDLENSIAEQSSQLSGSDLFTDLSPFKFYGNAVQIQFSQEELRTLNNKLKYIVKKKPEEVRYNQDKNHFIVSDKYDTDLDIQAFVIKLKESAPDLFKSEWTKPLNKCQTVAGIIDFEFFADSQGNLIFRPPEYNKTPLSLLLRMVELGRRDGISLAPPFLLQLISSRIDLIKEKLLTIELEIYEKSLLLGLGPGFEGAFSQFNVRLALVPLTGGSYSIDENNIIQEGNKSSVFTEDEQQKVVFKSTEGLASSTLSGRALVVDSIIDVRNQLGEIRGSTNARLTKDPTTNAKIEAELNLYDPITTGSFTNRLVLTNTVAQLVSQRQSLIPVFFKMATEAVQVNGAEAGLNLNSWNIIPEALGSFLDGAATDKPLLPKFLEDMIENDIANFDGFNSGKRFIINDDMVQTMTFGIKMPEYTRVDITGNQNFIDLGVAAGQIGNGAAVQWAGATDFDLWRQYGYRTTVSENKPFLQDPEIQCAPYAVFKLLQQRRKLHSGSVKVTGNEHYQAGDVVYVNSKQMLYYVESVSHSYDISHGHFWTDLTLTYGRPLGEYIPTPLDMIGKTLLANTKRSYGGVKVSRTLVPSSTIVNLETLVIPADTSLASVDNFKRLNKNRILNARQRGLSRLASSSGSLFEIEIRTYISSDLPAPTADFSGSFIASSEANKTAFAVSSQSASFYAQKTKELLTVAGAELPNLIADFSGSFVASAEANAASLLSNPDTLPVDKVKIVAAVDIAKPLKGDDFLLRRMPSEQAWANAMDRSSGATNGLPTNSIDIVLIINQSSRADGTPEQTQLEQDKFQATGGSSPVPRDANPSQNATLPTV